MSRSSYLKPDTIALHTGYVPESDYGSRAVPIYQTTSYVFESVADGSALFNVEQGGHIYSRITNPTVAVLEQRIAALEGGTGAICTASGMSALFASFITLCSAGDHIVSATQIYGSTATLLRHTMKRLNIECTFIPINDEKALRGAIQTNTKLVFCESIGNPGLEVADIPQISRIANESGLPLVVDATFATPSLCCPIDHGANIVVHSLTKWIGGHGLAVAGVVVDGGNFDWQARAFFQPKNTPMIVPTAYVTHGLLDAYDLFKDSKLLEVAISATDFIAKDLNKIKQEDQFAFSYSPLDNTVVFNASLMASQVLARVESYTGDDKYRDDASRSLHNCIKYQNNDGSWTYGTKPYHQWIDNFHTGYNLECIADYIKFSGESIDSKVLENGANYYLDTFFDNAGRYKYYSDTLFPLDINNAAQLIVTLSKLGKLESNLYLVNNVLDWSIANMQHKKGYFYYQKHRFYNIKIPYMRWSQAWMFYALSIYIKEIGK